MHGFNHILLLLLSALLPIAGLVAFPRLTQEILKDLRIPRILHYVSLAALGMALLLRTRGGIPPIFETEQYLLIPLFVIALTYAAVFAIVTNNLEDVAADRITNRGRPLVQGTVHPRAYLAAGIVCLLFALILGFAAHRAMFWGILTISAIYYVYSCRPFRLKRIPILSKFMIGLNSLVVAVSGFVVMGGEVFDFPVIWAIFILGPLTLAANFVDLKDTEGDRATGIATLPVLMGERRARHFVAFWAVVAYAMGGILLGIPWVYPLNALVAILHLYFLYRKPFQEKYVFLAYLAAIFGLVGFLLWRPGGSDRRIRSQAAIEQGVRFLEKIQRPGGAIADTVNPLFDTWETVLAAHALNAAVPENKRLDGALTFLKANTNAAGLICHNTKCRAGYCLETTSEYFLLLVDRGGMANVQQRLDTIRALQQPTGEWEIGNPDVRERKDFPSVTGFVLAALKAAGIEPRDPEAAWKWLIKTQQWNGQWGRAWEYYDIPAYALWPICRAMEGETGNRVSIARNRAEAYMRDRQRPDGSWDAGDGSPKRPSVELQTALMVAALLHGNKEVNTPAIEKGIDFLLQRQRKDGSWDGGEFPTGSDRYVKEEYVFATAMAIRVLDAYLDQEAAP